MDDERGAVTDMSELADLCLLVLVFFYSLNLAPMMFESFTSDRTSASNPPESFHLFLGPYGHKTAHYWKVVSPIALLSFVVSLFLNRHLFERELRLSIAFAVYLGIHAATTVYFVPEQERLTSNAGSLSRDVVIVRVRRWTSLNYFRNIAGVVAFVFLMLAVLVPSAP
jgi:hypothetical protein